MILGLFLCFVLAASVPYALAGEKSEEKDVALAMMFMKVCSSETDEIVEKAMEVDQVQKEIIDLIPKPCWTGLEDFSAKELKNYYYRQEGETARECHKCIENAVQNADNKAEIEEAMRAPMGCIMEHGPPEYVTAVAIAETHGNKGGATDYPCFCFHLA
ncbi:uncharacterized protein LOC129226199 [Uloborus diversus]|uniref:uncharacterized protein LOC129226199 n=1 Tax=Uloborus diversus TaxID=327109 RepID=UPI002408F79A|nr:uncharacterized protein LOC129226199 [Uloborus diversus]